jgi:prolyl-tRNA synthetase
VHTDMLKSATDFRDANLHTADSYEEMQEIVKEGGGWALIWHCGRGECEDRIKEDTKASSRCFPLDINEAEPAKGHKCVVCGKPAQGKAYFARAY